MYTDGRPRPVRFLLLRSPRPNHVLRSAPNNFWPNPPRSCTAAATAAAAVRVCNAHGKWFSMAGQRQLPPEPFANPFQRDRGPPSRRPRAKPRLHRFRQSFSNQMTPAAVLSDVSHTASLPFQGRVFLLLPFCKQNASLQQRLSHMTTVMMMMMIVIGKGEEAVANSRQNSGQMSTSNA